MIAPDRRSTPTPSRTPARRSAAERMQAYRTRAANGLVVLPLTIDEVETAQMLSAGGLLAAHDADDREKVAEALERQIANLIRLARYT